MKELRAASAEIKAGTQGRVDVKYYPGGVMGNDAVVLRKMRLGQLQGGVLTSSELAQVYPDAAIYSLPFLFDNWTQADKARALVDPMLAKGFEAKGMTMLSASDVGFAYVLSVKPLKSAKDVAGAKLWIPQNDEIAERTFKAGGSSPILLPLGDVFTSLQTGMVDAVPNTPAGAVALQWHGKLKNMIDLPLSFVVGFVVVDNKAFAKISAADQALVLKAFRACGARMDAAIKRDDVAALAAMKKQGLQVNEMPPAEVAHWKQIGAKVTQDMIAAGHISAPLVAAIRKSNTGK
jgi:TRAP-type C4-dicarboxylate transport system substrate-binding protein